MLRELGTVIFTESAPLGWLSHKVAMSVCEDVCLSVPSGAVFSEAIDLP